MNKFEMYSFPDCWTEEQIKLVCGEFKNEQELDLMYHQFLEDENEAREVYRSMSNF